MTTISFSVDKETKAELERIAKQQRRSKSAVFRDMYNAYQFRQTLAEVQRVGRKKFLELGIETIDQAEEYLG